MSNAANPLGAAIPKTGNAFIDSVSADAILSQRATGVPASVTLAQAILESAWGKSGLSKKYHNYFGIKGKGTKGTAVMSTGEHLNGKDVVIKDGFRVYASAAESFEDHGRFFIVNKRYAEAMRHTEDAERFAKEIHKAGYATDPNYSDKLIKLIRQYKLTAFDQIARGQMAVSPASTVASSQPVVVSTPGPSAAVKELQLLLVKYGCLTLAEMQTGPGVLGPKTHAALTRFLEMNSHDSPSNAGTGGSGSVTPAKVVPITASKPPPTAPVSGSLDYNQISKDFQARIPGSSHFTWHQALWLPSYKRHASAAEVTSTILQNIVRQAKALDKIQERFNKLIVVHCWLRPPAYNKLVGGARNSAHLRGAATDFHVEGYTAEQVRQVVQAEKLYPGAGELGVSWVHLDLEHATWFHP